MPALYEQLVETAAVLETHYHDMQDLEFTIEKGQMFLLQARSGKRTPTAAVKIAVDQVAEGLISKETALLRVKPESVSEMLHPEFDTADLARQTP